MSMHQLSLYYQQQLLLFIAFAVLVMIYAPQSSMYKNIAKLSLVIKTIFSKLQ